MDNDGYLNSTHKKNIKYIKDHKNEIDRGSKILCAHIIRKIIRQLNDRYDILMVTKEFKCFFKEDRLISDIRRVCLDVSNDYYVLVSVSEVNKLLETYGVIPNNEMKNSSSLFISYKTSRENLLNLINTNNTERKKKYVRNI